MSIERADKREAKPKERIFYRGKELKVEDASPIAIARALRKNSANGKRRARLEAAEAKVAGR